MKGYAYIENGIVVVNEVYKPEEADFAPNIGVNWEEYLEALSAWNDSCIEARNVFKSSWFKNEWNVMENGRITDVIIKFPQPVSFTKGKKAVITSINN